MGKKLICSNGGSLPEVVFGSVKFFQNRDSNNLADILQDILKGKDVFEEILEKDYSLFPIIKEMEIFYQQCNLSTSSS